MLWFLWTDYWTSRPYMRVTIRKTRFGNGWFLWDARNIMSIFGSEVCTDKLQLIEKVSHLYWL